MNMLYHSQLRSRKTQTKTDKLCTFSTSCKEPHAQQSIQITLHCAPHVISTIHPIRRRTETSTIRLRYSLHGRARFALTFRAVCAVGQKSAIVIASIKYWCIVADMCALLCVLRCVCVFVCICASAWPFRTWISLQCSSLLALIFDVLLHSETTTVYFFARVFVCRDCEPKRHRPRS